MHDVADIGAGTGKLTRALAARGLSVTAVEPDPEMLAALLAGAPGVRGRTPRPSTCPSGTRASTCCSSGQAWHWFDAGPTAREFRRVLRPGGVVGILWNDRDDAAAPWLGELRTLLEDHFVAEYTSDESARSLEEVFPGVEADLFANTLGPRARRGHRPGVDVLLRAAPRRRRRGDRLARVLLPDPVEVDGRLGHRDPPPHRERTAGRAPEGRRAGMTGAWVTGE